jgi:hypothetical protein
MSTERANGDFVQSAAPNGNDDKSCLWRRLPCFRNSENVEITALSVMRELGIDSAMLTTGRFDCAHDRVSNGKSRIPDIVDTLLTPEIRPACVDSLMNLSKITQCTE